MYRTWLLYVLVAPFGWLNAFSAAHNIFKSYPNTYFVETGSYLGDGIALALEAGFPYIYSVELSEPLYQHCCQRFRAASQVHLCQGDSAFLLNEILKRLDAPATFWLDGHYSGGDTVKGARNTPILEELAVIASHPIKTHTIIIDDVYDFGTPWFDFITASDIAQALLKINHNYILCVEYRSNGTHPWPVLIASVNNWIDQ